MYVHTAKLINCSYAYAYLAYFLLVIGTIMFSRVSRTSKILAMVPKHHQSSNDEESSDSSNEMMNFNFQKRDSTESSPAPSLPSSLENLHFLSDDDYNLSMSQITANCPSISMKPKLSLDSFTQDSLHSIIPPSPVTIIYKI